MFGLGPIIAMLIGPRIVARNARPRMRRSVLVTELALAADRRAALLADRMAGVPARVGARRCSPGRPGSGSSTSSTSSRTPTGSAATTGSTPTPALRGSSYLKLPRVLEFFTGNIGFHHVHHLTRASPTTTCSARTTRTRSSTTSRRSRSGTGSRREAEALGRGARSHGHLRAGGARRGTRSGRARHRRRRAVRPG